MAIDIYDPLGLPATPPARRLRRAWVFGVAALVALSLCVGLGLRFERRRSPAVAVATITTLPPPPAPVLSKAPPPAAPSDSTTEAGVTVFRGGGAAPPGSLVINVKQALGLQLAPAPDARLVEKSRYGPLPKIGLDGSRPREIYARPIMSALPATAPRIVLVVGGMGLSDPITRAATETLPGAVTLAFAPYGDHLEANVAAARASGHEVLLQTPMESFDGTGGRPHMLRVDADPRLTTDDLHWFMSRFTGYVGLANFLGAKFMADEKALRPVLQEASTRGLMVFDDGSSTRSLVATVGRDVGVPTVSADVSLDGDDIEDALTKLEATARSKGLAIGMANGLPRTVERLARFAQGLEAHGISLVPLSATIGTSPDRASVVTRVR